MGEGVSVVQADVRELHEVLLLCNDVLQDVFRNALQRRRVEGAVLLDAVESCRHVLYGGDARLFLHDIIGRRELELGIHGGDGHALESRFFQTLDVCRTEFHALRQVAGAERIVYALRCDHAVF